MGGTRTRHFRDVYRLRIRDGRLETEDLPPLPAPCSFAAGAAVGGTLYIAGGIERPDATTCLKTLWALDLDRPGADWRVLEPCPGPERILAVAGASGESFYLFSGARLRPDADGRPVREYLRDAWQYRPQAGWKRLADLPRAAVAAPSPAPLTSGGRLLVISGDDGTKIGFQPETEHPGFPRDVLEYDLTGNTWSIGSPAPISRATVPAALWRGAAIIASGEKRPGYRSPEVWSLESSAR